MRHSVVNSNRVTVLILLLTAAFVAGCGGGDSADQVAPASGGESQSTQQGMSQKPESDDIEYMVRLVALDGAQEWWFLDLASVRADPELAPLNQNLTDTWNGWNQDSSDEFGLTLQDAAFAVSLPSDAVFLGGIENVEGLQETVAGLGYQQQEERKVTYWVNPDRKWHSFIFLPNGMLIVMAEDPSYFLQGTSNFINYGSWDEDRDWQGYRDELGRGGALDVGSIDDVVSDIRNSLMFHFDNSYDTQSMWAKAGDETVKETIVGGFSDDDSAKLAETEAKEALSQLRAEAESAEQKEQGEETDEERYMREYLSACTDQEVDRSGKEVTVTQVCRTDWFDFRYANYLLSIR